MRATPRHLTFAAAMLLAVGVASCDPPLADNPLSDPASAKPDPRLSGLWAGRLGDADEAILQIFPKTGAAFDLVLTGSDGDRGAAVLAFDGFPSSFGGQGWMSLRAKRFQGDYADSFELAPRWLFVKYEIGKDGALTLWKMDEDPLKAAVEAGSLAGKIENGDVHLTADSAALAKWVLAADPTKLLEKIGTFRRVALPKGSHFLPGGTKR